MKQDQIVVERVQTGVRMEKRLVKVLKAIAEFYDLSLGCLLEDLVLSTFTGRNPFRAADLDRIGEIMRIYDLKPAPARLPSEEPRVAEDPEVIRA